MTPLDLFQYVVAGTIGMLSAIFLFVFILAFITGLFGINPFKGVNSSKNK